MVTDAPPESKQLAAPARRASRLGGREKAAVLLVSLGHERAAEVFRHLKEDEIEALSLDMAKLQQVPADVSAEVWEEMVETCLAEAYLAEGGVEFAREVLERAVGPERAREIVGRLTVAIERRPFEFLRRTPPEQIHAFIRNEAPQTVALVIANLHTDLAAQVLALLEAEVGEVCTIEAGRRRAAVPAEVVGFRAGRTLLMPLGEIHGIGPGHAVAATGQPVRVPVGDELLGRVIDGLGRPIDGLDRELPSGARSTQAPPPASLSRPRITQRVSLGVRALDAFVPCGRGQRLGIFAGSGVGKSSLLGMIARSCTADVSVIALVGERGREVREFIERDLGDAISRSVVVVATSDEPALLRIKAAFTATTIAEHFRPIGVVVVLGLAHAVQVVVDLEEHRHPVGLQLADGCPPRLALRKLKDDDVVGGEVGEAAHGPSRAARLDVQRGRLAADADPVAAERTRGQRAAIPGRHRLAPADEEDVHRVAHS
ncbi:hypothetical protein BH20ACT16_BH20ACT16_10510 [soil metagenome]